MVHNHPGRLHECVADGRTNETEAGLFQCTAHGPGLRRGDRHLAVVGEMIDLRISTDELPEPVDRILFPGQPQPGLRILPGRPQLQAMADDAGVLRQLLQVSVRLRRHEPDIEAAVDLPVTLALAQDGDPRQARLQAFEHQHLEQVPGVPAGHAPLLIVVALVERVSGTPLATAGSGDINGHGRHLTGNDRIILVVETPTRTVGSAPWGRLWRNMTGQIKRKQQCLRIRSAPPYPPGAAWKCCPSAKCANSVKSVPAVPISCSASVRWRSSIPAYGWTMHAASS